MLTNYTNAPQLDLGIIDVAKRSLQVGLKLLLRLSERRHVPFTLLRDILRDAIQLFILDS